MTVGYNGTRKLLYLTIRTDKLCEMQTSVKFNLKQATRRVCTRAWLD
jgi:hypothetical protein